MISLNHILLFLAVVSPLAVLGRAWYPGGTARGWSTAALVVLAITGLAWIFFRRQAGYIGGGAWLALLFVPAIGLRRTVELAAQRRYQAARRLAQLMLLFHPSQDLRDQVTLFRNLESRQAGGLIPGPQPHRGGRFFFGPVERLRHAPAVTALILLNIAAFILEIGLGRNRDPEILLRLGALDFWSVTLQHEYWRVVTALFLHYGALHLLFNLFALYILGPPLEWTIGRLRFAICYLVAGIGSSLGVLGLMWMRAIERLPVVGASGCVMGIVGVWAGFLLRHRHAPQARERLANIIMIIVVQVLFDRVTPQVSSSAHLCGLATGFLLGLLVGPKPAPAGN